MPKQNNPSYPSDTSNPFMESDESFIHQTKMGIESQKQAFQIFSTSLFWFIIPCAYF